MLLKLLYTRGSLHNQPTGGVAFSLKNRLDTVRVTGFEKVQVGDMTVPADRITVALEGEAPRPAAAIDATAQAVDLPVGRSLTLQLDLEALPEGIHQVQIWFTTDAFGRIAY